MTTKNKATLRNHTITDCPLFELDIVLRNVRCIYHEMTLFRTVGAQHTYCDWLKVAAKTVAKHLHQNQAINIEILKDQ